MFFGCPLVCRNKKKYFFWSMEDFCWVEFDSKFDPLFHFCEFTFFLWQSKIMLKHFINFTEMVFLERWDQELSIGGLISMLPFCLVGWNFTWTLPIFTVLRQNLRKAHKKCKMAKNPLSSGQNAFLRVFVLKSVFRFFDSGTRSTFFGTP